VPDTPAIVMGWGTTQSGQLSPVLMQAEVPITLNPQPSTQNPKTQNPDPLTLNPKS